jgi:flavorubredoxin
METKINEIADGIIRLSTYVPQIAPPAGFTFCQFLVRGEEPFLFHCGPRSMFPSVSEALKKIAPIDSLRWISFGHVEADECGAMNDWLAAAPRAEVAHGGIACAVSLNDLADRAPRPLANGEVIDIGGKRLRYLDTPHVPHGWDAGVFYEETTGTLLCGDLFTHVGDTAAATEDDILEPAMAAEEMFGATSLTAVTAPTLRKLAKLQPRTLALMHGASYRGNGATLLNGLADFYDRRVRTTLQQAAAA